MPALRRRVTASPATGQAGRRASRSSPPASAAGSGVEPRYGKLAARVLSAAGGMTAGLATEGPLPSRRDIMVLVEELLEVLFPESHRLGTDGGRLQDHVATTIASLELHLERAIFLCLHRTCAKKGKAGKSRDDCDKRARALTARLLDALPDIRAQLGKDVLAAYDSDPAATGIDEIVACYPGLYAIAVYRVAHRLLGLGAEVLPRMLTEHAHSRTGIDIHPGATIGESFFIDHGTGIVFGETATIGNRVRIYQGVTLGALSIRDRGLADKPEAQKKRHPTIEDDVIIYANATILGGKTVIGQGAVVGGNAWITYSVPPRTRVGVGT
jgi:serine O-acetyltransferase